MYLVKNGVMLVATLPSLFYFVKYTIDFAVQENFLWYFIGPPNIFSLLFCDIFPIQVLGFLGCSGGLLRFYISRQIRKESLRYI